MASSGSSGGSGSSEEHEASVNQAKPNFSRKIYDIEHLDPEVEEAVRKYRKQIAASEGFDCDDYPPDIGEVGYIVPYLMPNREFRNTKNMNELINSSMIAMIDYNEKHDTNFKFVKVLKANSLVVQGVIFYITFEAKGDDNDADEGETEMFQAKVYFGNWDGRA
ncbi:uncharacterized protein LOC132267398 [Cornus florida]|uniref:uncharacterized protein LOC132267398 n=1 Tax=Cornus florida TaxID=4283 RepID=UPI00289C1BB8|nr:uncharacterized protein LOC132267398 [Cornus florida]